MDLNLIVLLFSAFSFIFYGISSFFSRRMLSEYARWGYKDQRILLGCLQLLGGFGITYRPHERSVVVCGLIFINFYDDYGGFCKNQN